MYFTPPGIRRRSFSHGVGLSLPFEAMTMRRSAKDYSPSELTAWIRSLIAADDLHAFYICKAWLHLRAQALEAQNYECQLCKAAGRYVPATVVHHVRPVRAAPWLALTQSNLMCLCGECHYRVHHEREEKWNDERW